MERRRNMATSVRVPVKKEIWFWAIKESQRDLNEILARFPKMDKWINQEENPTFNQLEKVAKFLRVPFGYMFLDKPPKENVMETEFRTINNKLPDVSKNLKDTIMEMDRRRNWMSDYRKSLGWDKLDIIIDFSKHKSQNIIDNAVLAKKLLGLDDNWYKSIKTLDEAYRILRNKLENAGILVMQNGVVGMNNYRKLDIKEFRAFVLYDDVAPLIFINSRDSKAGKIFSLIHEYIHVLFEQEDVFSDRDIDDLQGYERRINSITAEFLMPQEHISRFWQKDKNILDQLNELSKDFKVSRLALAIKLKDMNLVDSEIVEQVKRESIQNFDSNETSSYGGNFYTTLKTRISPTFAKAVIRNAEAGEISYTYAFRLLGGIKGKTYEQLKESLLYYE